MEEGRQDIPAEGCAKALWQEAMQQEEKEEGWWGENKQSGGWNCSSWGWRGRYSHSTLTLWAK